MNNKRIWLDVHNLPYMLKTLPTQRATLPLSRTCSRWRTSTDAPGLLVDMAKTEMGCGTSEVRLERRLVVESGSGGGKHRPARHAVQADDGALHGGRRRKNRKLIL